MLGLLSVPMVRSEELKLFASSLSVAIVPADIREPFKEPEVILLALSFMMFIVLASIVPEPLI